MINTDTQLPSLTKDQEAHSAALSGYLQKKILEQGPIAFDVFMQTCLYQPDLGYYASARSIFGEQGDFITAPELSPLFSRALANQCVEIFHTLPEMNIIELGAGSGSMALSIMQALKSQDCLPQQYTIVETSSQLIQRQQALMAGSESPIKQRVAWSSIEALPTQNAIVIANEFFDALPFRRFELQTDGWVEWRVNYEHETFAWCTQAVEQETREYLQKLQQHELLVEPQGPVDIPMNIDTCFARLTEIVQQGVVLIVDYGITRQEASNPERGMASLRCFFQHHLHSNPFTHLGQQDITCHVPFSILANTAIQHGFTLNGFTTQAHFLLGNRLDELYTAALAKEQQDTIKLAQEFKTLTMPDEMGERFKVIALGKEYCHRLSGFSIRDFSYQL